MEQEYTTIEQLRALLSQLVDNDETNQELLTNTDVIKLQRILETFLANQNLNAQAELDWQDFCNNLKSYITDGYKIDVISNNELVGTITASMFDNENNLPTFLNTKGIINLSAITG